MKGSQFSVKVYETVVENEEQFIAFFDSNYTLFKDHLISIRGVLSKEIREYLKEKNLSYVHNKTIPKSRLRKNIEDEFSKEREEIETKHQQMQEEIERLSIREETLTVLDGIVRSGREIKIDGDLLLLNRVNSGASIETSGNLIMTEVVEGNVRCNGSFMMISPSPKANIIFNGIAVESDLLKDKLNKIELKNHRIEITPVLKKETNWV
ncbi:MAG: hypothetical protein QM493_08450 [Sulfurovum sp.]